MATTAERQFKSLTAKKNSLFAILQTLYDLSKKLDSETNKEKFKILYLSLESTRDSFISVLDEINLVGFDTNPDYTPDYNVLRSVNELCCHINNAYLKKIGKPEEKTELSTTVAESRVPQLPKIDLPEFSGEIRQWETFHSLFKSMIHINASLTNLDKIHYLVGRLRGPALGVCAGVSIVGDNYEIVYNALKDKYENKRYLANSYLQQILEFKPIVGESEKGLNIFLERFDVAVSALKRLNLPNLSEFILFQLALSKLDKDTVRAFEMKYRDTDMPTYTELINFVKSQSKILNYNITKPSSSGQRGNYAANSGKSQKPVGTFVATESKGKRSTCTFCNKSGHYLGVKCDKFKALSPSKRYEAVRDNNWCFNCLSSSHGVRNCPTERTCVICTKKHHVLLHTGKPEASRCLTEESVAPTDLEGAVSPLNNDETLDTHLCAKVNELNNVTNYTTLLSTVVVTVVNSAAKNSNVRLILDSGSQANLLTLGCCKRLGLKISKYCSSIQGLGSSPQAVKGITTLTITSRFNSENCFTINALLVEKITDKLPKFKVDCNALPDFRGVALADDHFDQPGVVDGILGVELFATILGSNRIGGVLGSPVAIQTAFGYVVMGKIPILNSPPLVFFTLQEQSIEHLLTKFWEVEQVPKRDLMDPGDVHCESIFSKTYNRDVSGRYTVALPFKITPDNLGDSRRSAGNRLFSLEKRLAKDRNLRLEYNEVMQDFLEQGHMRLVNDSAGSGLAYYIAHHPVIKLSSTSTPVRIVLDASAPSDNGVSLNDILHSGPKLQTDITTLLLNFRLFKVAVTADIRQMYRQINVIEEHWRFQRLLWRFNAEDDVQTYELKVVAFGLKSSPYLALRTVRQLLEDEGRNYPLAAQYALRDLYMDDFCCSVDSEEQALQLYKESVSLFRSGGFALTKWSANSLNLLENIPIECRLSDNVTFKTDTKILGIQWNPKTDNLSFSLRIPDPTCTKRAILSTVARCWDPIGLLAPFILFLKLLIKDLWLLKLDWDEPVPDHIYKIWNNVCTEWGALEQFKVPRHLGASERQPIIILGFADASLDGYGAVVYARTVSSLVESDVRVQLVCAKSKVSPTKPLTVPRLELLASLLLSNIVKHILETYNDRICISKVLAFSDSSVVLSWLKMPYLKDIFVSNRIMQIKENIPNALWYHIEGIQNPADCLSRGLTPVQLINHPRWLSGPTWITLPENEWPLLLPSVNNSEANETSEVFIAKENPFEHHPLLELVERISSWQKILRITVWVLRFLKILPCKRLVTADDLQKAELVLIKLVQRKHFNSEIQNLNLNKDVSRNFQKLRPFVQDGLLRVGGRIEKANLSFPKRHPIILPAKSQFTEKLVDYYHHIHLHTGAYLLEALLRQKYWIMGARNLIRNRIHKCNRCFRLRPTTVNPLMADLPAARVQEAHVFSRTGVDYFGPINITMGRKRNAPVHKAYVSLFICMSVKAIHLELVSSLSSQHFLQAFKRFTSRRGPVEILYSDRGTNFVGAKSVLREINEFINSPEYINAFQTELGVNGIEWKFNTPAAPHMGGLWESNVKSVKNHLYRVIGDQLLTYEELSTVLTQVEALLNSRPLCSLSSDPDAPEALTPAHFLTLTPLRGFPAKPLFGISRGRLDRFQLVDRMIQDFWKRWRLEYLTSLQTRPKWSKNMPNIKVGSVVILKTDNVPPLHWPLAVVSEVHPGSDGVIRNVTLRTGKGTFTRPAVKVYALPTQ